MWVAMGLSVLIGVSLGLFGGGGSILTTPILMYALGLEPKVAIATSLVIVGVTSLFGVFQRMRTSDVEWSMGLTFGLAGMLGAGAGGTLARVIPDRALLVMFALMMIGTAIAMFRGRRSSAAEHGGERHPLWQIGLQGVGFGVVTGLIGAGGGFLVVPALALLGGLPMRKAVGTSLLVIALNCAAGFAAHARHVTVDFALAAEMSGAAIVGSFLGGMLIAFVAPDTLRRAFAVFVMVLGAFVLVRQV